MEGRSKSGSRSRGIGGVSKVGGKILTRRNKTLTLMKAPPRKECMEKAKTVEVSFLLENVKQSAELRSRFTA